MSNQNIKLELSIQEVEFILQTISEKPLKEVIGIFSKIDNQASKQIKK